MHQSLANKIKYDISRCKEVCENNEVGNSYSLYRELIAAYTAVDDDFLKGIPRKGTVNILGESYNYLNQLRAIAAKLEMWLLNDPPEPMTFKEMLNSDILKCQKYLTDPQNESLGRSLYNEITSKYDQHIENFGYGLYNYDYEHRFYYDDIDIETINGNLQMLLYKMESYQSKQYENQTFKRGQRSTPNSKRVFIVHGHDDGALHEVARFVEKLDLEPIILREQASTGRTIIQKFEDYSDVSFGIVLYTPCDLGRAKSDNSDSLKPRARQNVVFEHGYLISLLGREHVLALTRPGVEQPGDLDGVVYVELDPAGGWKQSVVTEMGAVGIPLNKSNL